MRNYILRRLLQLIPVLLGISIAIFAVLRLIPGGFASGMLGIDATPELIAQVNARYGLDQPVVTQYLKWMGGVLRGDFGQSFRSGAEILPEILTRFKVTAELTILAAVVSWIIALPLGMLAAVKQYNGGPRGARGGPAGRVGAGVCAVHPDYPHSFADAELLSTPELCELF